MNTSIRLLKLTILFSFLILQIHCSAEVNEASSSKKSTQTENNSEKEKLIRFFLDYLSGKAESYTATSSFSLSDIQQQQALVWEAWVEANHRFQEEPLIELRPLAEKKSGEWQLPSNLEPNAIMPYYWGSKGEVPSSEGYPLYLYLHGSGEKKSEWATGFQLCSKFDDAPSAYFIPQIPNMGNYYRWWQKSKQFAWEKLLRLALASGQINPNRIYIFGISEGGYGSQRLASFYADYLAGAGPMAGGEPLKNAPVENCRNMAFSLRTGADDAGFYRNKLTGYTKTAFEEMQKLHPNEFIHHIELIPDHGHFIDYSVTTPWLKQYTRNPYPKYVNWENFEMDGLYRKGFYNLAVKERSNPDEKSRTYYELAIQGNNITLKADLVTYTCTEKDPRWGIELKFEKSYQPATQGKVIIYLCPELVDLNKKITLTVNGKQVFKGKVTPSIAHMANSCATFFDPERIYPAAIEVDLGNLK